METITTKEQALELIQSIVKNERFKVDAYFFCGFPTDQPNEKLIQLCEAYLEKRDTETKTAMLGRDGAHGLRWVRAGRREERSRQYRRRPAGAGRQRPAVSGSKAG